MALLKTGRTRPVARVLLGLAVVAICLMALSDAAPKSPKKAPSKSPKKAAPKSPKRSPSPKHATPKSPKRSPSKAASPKAAPKASPMTMPVHSPMDMPMDMPMHSPMDMPMDMPMHSPMDMPMDMPMHSPMPGMDPMDHMMERVCVPNVGYALLPQSPSMLKTNVTTAGAKIKDAMECCQVCLDNHTCSGWMYVPAGPVICTLWPKCAGYYAKEGVTSGDTMGMTP